MTFECCYTLSMALLYSKFQILASLPNYFYPSVGNPVGNANHFKLLQPSINGFNLNC